MDDLPAAGADLVPLLSREANLVDLTLCLVTEEHILRDHRMKYGRLQQQPQDLWERYAEDELSASQLIKEWAKFTDLPTTSDIIIPVLPTNS